MGGFHTVMMFLGVIGIYFKNAGLQDILIQSGGLADGSAMFSDRSYIKTGLVTITNCA